MVTAVSPLILGVRSLLIELVLIHSTQYSLSVYSYRDIISIPTDRGGPGTL